MEKVTKIIQKAMNRREHNLKKMHDWYVRNKERLSVTKKDRYSQDKEYRDDCIKRAKKRWLTVKLQRQKARSFETTKPIVKELTDPKRQKETRIIFKNGKAEVLFPTYIVIQACNITSGSLNSLIRNKLIPAPDMRDSIGRGWFSKEYIRRLRSAIKRRYETWALGEKRKQIFKECFVNYK